MTEEKDRLFADRINHDIINAEHHGWNPYRALKMVMAREGFWRRSGQRTIKRFFGLYPQYNIQKAIDHAESKVFVRDANYNIDTTLLIQGKTDLTLEGENWVSTRLIAVGGDTTVILIGDRVAAGLASQNIIVKNLYIDGTAQTTETLTPEANDRRFGIEMASPAEQTEKIVIEKCQVYNTGSDGIYGYFCGPVTVRENMVESVRGYWAGIHLHDGGDTLGPAQAKVTGNTLRGCLCSGIRHGRQTLGNYVFECGKTGESDGREAGIVGGRYGIANENVVVCLDKACQGIKSHNQLNEISNNTISVADLSIFLNGYYGHTVIGNQIIENGGASAIRCNSDRSRLIGNIIEEAGQDGIVLVAALRCIVRGNTLRNIGQSADNTFDAISLEGVNSIRNLIEGNQIESDAANLPRYGLNEADANQDYNEYKSNIITNVNVVANLLGLHDRLPTVKVPFVDGSDPDDSGFQVLTDDTHYARAYLLLPNEVQQTIRMKVHARAVILGAAAMRAQFIIYGAADNEVYTTHNGSVNNHPSTSTGFAADDIIFWTITEAGVLALLGEDSVEVRVQHAAAGNGDVVTNAYFRTVSLEYV